MMILDGTLSDFDPLELERLQRIILAYEKIIGHIPRNVIVSSGHFYKSYDKSIGTDGRACGGFGAGRDVGRK